MIYLPTLPAISQYTIKGSPGRNLEAGIKARP